MSRRFLWRFLWPSPHPGARGPLTPTCKTWGPLPAPSENAGSGPPEGRGLGNLREGAKVINSNQRFWSMTPLLMGTLLVAGLHTAAWLPRSLQYSKELNANGKLQGTDYVRRFRPFDRNLHLMVITSFLGLAMTGMMLKFS